MKPILTDEEIGSILNGYGLWEGEEFQGYASLAPKAVAEAQNKKTLEWVIKKLDVYIQQVVECEKYREGDALIDPVLLAALNYHWQSLYIAGS